MILKMEENLKSVVKQEFIRNHKEFRVEKNRKILRIIGNGNRIFVKKNCGDLEIIGNNTSLFIIENCGKVEYTGNNGRVYFGEQSEVKNCNYCGNDGHVKILSENVIVERSTKKEKISNCEDEENKKTEKVKSSNSSKKERTFVINNNISATISDRDLLINSQIKIRTNCATDITISNRLSL